MNTVLVLVCVLAHFSVSLAVKDTQTCLTWNVTDDHLFLKCNVFRLKHNMQMIDASKQIRVECINHSSLNCVTNRDDDFVFTNVSENGFSLVLKTAKTNGEGDWTCLHGTNEANVNIRISEGTVYSADVQLSGEVTEMKDHFKFTLTCFSCWVPYTKNVNFFVNNVLEDSVRYSDGKCYHKRKACSPTECTCATEGNNFTWAFISDLSTLEFSCEMKFKDENHLSIQTARLLYNETEFKQEGKRINTISVLDKEFKQEGKRINTISVLDKGDYQKNIEVATIVVPTMSVTAVVVISTFICVFPDITGRMKKRMSRYIYGVQVKKDNVLFKKKCRVCENLSTCAICIDCKQGFCDPCCDKHLKFEENRLHKVYQIKHVATSQEITKCDITKCKKIAERVCTSCWVQRCVSCVTKDHDDKCTDQEIILIHQTSSESPTKETGLKQDKLEHLRTIPIQGDKYPVRIYGIAFLEDGTLVAIDKNNKKIIIFAADFKHVYETLESEPSSMTAMTGNEIAVTFPCIKHIKVYTIYLNSTEGTATCIITKVIEMSDLGINFCILRPFSIAFNKDVFAVEVGEGEDGKIIIFENNSNKTYNIAKTIQCKFAYFTGHTIRLALAIDLKDMDNKPRGRLYLSTMSNQMVSCIDLEGKKLWEVSMPSPRSIIIVPKKHSFGESIILSSRRMNAIYELNKERGKNKILQASKINSPRYIACHFEKNTFCILVRNEEQEDELAIFEFRNVKKQDDGVNNPEINELTSLV